MLSLCPNCKKHPRRRPGQRCKACDAARQRSYRRSKPAPQSVQITDFKRTLSGKRYLITSAQNATPVHARFLASLKVAAAHLRAELVIIPLRYKNATSVWTEQQESDDWWDPAVVPYLCNERKHLNDNLVLAGDVKSQPTAASPLTGFEGLTGGESCIIGHPRMQFRSVPVPSGKFPKILTTTGACTVNNYSDTRAGKLGEFHHFLGAVIVELDGKKFHLRQLNADSVDGSFTDLATHYTSDGAVDAAPALALVMGDTHARFACPKVDAATFGKGGIVDTLDPQTLVWHDIVDGDTTNPHHVGNPFLAEAKRKSGKGDVRGEIQHVADFVRTRAAGRQAVIVDSNHHDFLARWLVRHDWKHDPKNAEFYLETALFVHRSAEMTDHGGEYADPFPWWLGRLGAGENVRCLGSNESFTVADIECGMHGHRGPNGARGSLKNLSRLGSKVITGHSHTPGIAEGHYQVGTSTPLRLEYTKGPSSWLNAHAVIYATGKRSLIVIIDGAWRLP